MEEGDEYACEKGEGKGAAEGNVKGIGLITSCSLYL